MHTCQARARTQVDRHSAYAAAICSGSVTIAAAGASVSRRYLSQIPDSLDCASASGMTGRSAA